MKNIVTRAVSGTIYVAVIVSATIAGGYWFFALTGILAATAAFEYQRMVAQAEGHDIPLAIRMTDFAATMLLWLAVPAYVYTAAAYPGYEGKAIVATLIAVTAIMVLYLIIRMALALLQSGPAAFSMAGRSYLGVLYIGVPVALLNALDDTGLTVNLENQNVFFLLNKPKHSTGLLIPLLKMIIV